MQDRNEPVLCESAFVCMCRRWVFSQFIIMEIICLLQKREAAIEAGTFDPMNPWVNQLTKRTIVGQEISEDNESFTKFKQFWEEVNSRKVKDIKIMEELNKKEKENVEQENGGEMKEVKTEDNGDEENTEVVKEDDDKDEKSEVVQEDDDGEEKSEVLKEDKAIEVKTEIVEEDKQENKESKEKTKIGKKKRKRKRKQRTDVNIDDASDGGDKLEAEEEDAAKEAVSIDEMFDDAEIEIQKKVKRKLSKLGIQAESGQTWTKTKQRKKPKVTHNAVPAKIEEFDFTCKKVDDNIDEKLERVKTLEDMDTIQDKNSDKSTDKLQQAADILKKGNITEEPNNAVAKSSSRSGVEVDPSKFLQVRLENILLL